MKTLIKKLDQKYYVFYVDLYGNLYDSMRSFKTKQAAVNFTGKLK